MASKTKLLKQMELFDEISNNGLSPNQYYLICCIKDNISAININIHLELRYLMNNEWIYKRNNKESSPYGLTPKSITLITKLEKIFSITKRKTNTKIMGDKFKENIEKYKTMFPNIKLPSGKAARSAYGNLEKNFRWFFEQHPYEWDTVLKATAHYVDKGRRENWKFMRTSQYFIRKDNLSDLADYCEIILTGGDDEERTTFKTRVV